MPNNQVSLIVTPLRSAMLAGHANKVQVLVRVQAPNLPENKKQQRQPYGIGFVIDRSGSMAGVPLKEAVRCVRFMSDKLTDQDFASLVTFDSHVALEFPLSPMTERSDLNEALAEVDAGGQTNLHGGWREAVDEFVRKETKIALKRVVLLSDGCANNGLLNRTSITRQVAKFASEGITTSTYGLGRHFNEELMIDMAKAGQGNHYYAETADDLLESFNEEFELMSNLWAKGLRIQVIDDKNVKVKLLNEYVKLEAHTNIWALPNLAYGSEAWAMFELTMSKEWHEGDLAELFSIKVTGEDIDGNELLACSELLRLPVINSVAFAAIANDELVKRRLDELQAAEYLKQARRAVKLGNWDEADYILDKAKQLFSDSPWAQDVLEAMTKLAARRDEMMFMKEASFSSSKMSTRLSSKHEESALVMESSIPAFLRRKSAQGKKQFFDEEQNPK